VFTGGDAEDGLDLDGTFLYAFSVMPDTAAIGQVRDAVFTSENVEGVSVQRASSQAPGWFIPEFGSTPNDDALELIVQNIRHGDGGALITLSNVVAGNRYKLQLLFGEACCARAMDVEVDGKLIADEFAPYELQGSTTVSNKGAVLSYEFTAATNQVVIETLGGAAVTTPRHTDTNPIINALTLESLGVAGPTAPRITALSLEGGVSVTIESVAGTTYNLEYKASLSDASWSPAGSATATGNTTVIQDTTPAHATASTGFWRVRVQ
jgi:hypothetical protein